MTEASGDAVSDADRVAIQRQLGREPRGMVAVAHRCSCGEPDVVTTSPRLPDGTPFPTLYYLTCSRLASRLGGLEATGRMREMTERLAQDPELAQDLVDELIVALDRAMGGTFREYLDPAERALTESGSGNSPARNS